MLAGSSASLSTELAASPVSEAARRVRLGDADSNGELVRFSPWLDEEGLGAVAYGTGWLFCSTFCADRGGLLSPREMRLLAA
jgi:hypothetical protein